MITTATSSTGCYAAVRAKQQQVEEAREALQQAVADEKTAEAAEAAE